MTHARTHHNPRAALAGLAGVTVMAGGRAILEGVDLALHRGEIVTVIGLNGSGKTTLVRALLGLVRPARGRAWRRPGLRIGYTPQAVSRDPTLPLTLERFLRLGGGAPADIPGAIAAVGLETRLLRAQLWQLSGGEMHRALIARAALRRPDLLVLDEPMSGVDIAGQAELYDHVGALRDRFDCAVLLVSHDLHVVMARADRVICLNRHICCQGRPGDVAGDAAFRALFGDRLAASLAPYVHRHDHRHAPDGAVTPAPETAHTEHHHG
jgi:zinc transport system ATP-binding protein